MASKETLVSQRGAQRAAATKCVSNAKLEMNKIGGDGADHEILVSFMNKLTEKLEKIKIFDSQILEHLTENAEISEEALSQDDKNLEIEITIEKLKAILNKPPAGGSTIPKASGGAKGPLFTKLPKLEIKPFFGNPLEYSSFFQQFNASIGTSSLPEVSKFSYLKSLVRGEAAKAIGGFALTDENYTHALHTLEERFGKKTLIIDSLMSEFTDLKPILEIRNTKGLRSLLDKVKIGIRSLESLGIEMKHMESY